MANRVQLAFKYIFSASFRCAFTKTVCIRNWKAASTCWCQSLIEPWLKYLSRSLFNTCWCPWETLVRLNTLLPPTLKFTCNQAWLPNNQETYCCENEFNEGLRKTYTVPAGEDDYPYLVWIPKFGKLRTCALGNVDPTAITTSDVGKVQGQVYVWPRIVWAKRCIRYLHWFLRRSCYFPDLKWRRW